MLGEGKSLTLVFLAEGDKKMSKAALRKSFELPPSSSLVVLEDTAFEEIWLRFWTTPALLGAGRGARQTEMPPPQL